MKPSLSNPNLKLLTSFLPYLSFALCQLANLSLAATPTVNYNLLVGEWSKPGECERNRYIYTANGQYMWIEKNEQDWRSVYTGIYVIDSQNPNSIVIAEGRDMGGDVITISELTPNTFKGEWNVSMSEELNFDHPEDAVFSYIKCPTRQMKK